MKEFINIIKENKIKSIILSLVLIVIVAAFSYAFFFTTASGTSKTVTFGSIVIDYVDGDTINFNNSLPLSESSENYESAEIINQNIYEYAPKKEFSVKNTGTLTSYLKIELTSINISDSLKSSDFRWALYNGTTRIGEGNFEKIEDNKITLSQGLTVGSNATQNFTVLFWIRDNGKNQNSMLNSTFNSKITVTGADKNVVTNNIFHYSGRVETFRIGKTGTYKIEAAGAEGSLGNYTNYTGKLPIPGKGATISANFNLNSGDEITIVVGGKGEPVVQSDFSNGTSGAGGGGSFVFKKISSITNSGYQISKGGKYYEVLLVAAGGGGTNDVGYQQTPKNGLDGMGSSWVVPGGTAYSAVTAQPDTSNSLSNVLGISQFINYNSSGGFYRANGGLCRGGFGGGGCTDNNQSYGGGWSGLSYQAMSFSNGTNTSGTTGSKRDNGYIKIELVD